MLFINPCLRKGVDTKMLPVGLAYVMTYVKSKGFDFDLLDVDAYDLSDDDVEHYLQNNNHDVYLFGSIVTHYKWAKWLVKKIKNYYPDSIVIVGNSVAGSCYEVFMKNAPNDVTVIGEGEITTYEVLKAIRDKLPFEHIEGIAYRSNGVIIKNKARKALKKIDEYPMIDWNLFDVKKYIESQSNRNSFGSGDETISMPVVTARGCAFRCTFCHFVFWDDPYRYRSPASIIEEIKRNINEYGANYINFWDDLSFASLNQVERLVDAILESGLIFDWSAAIRTDLLGNPKHAYERRLKVAEKMKLSGCKAVGFSLESGDPDILQMMEKRIDTEYFTQQIQILHKVGIVCNTSVVFGYPLETPESIQKTFQMCLKNRVYPSIGFLLPLPYTKMYEYAKANHYIIDEDAFLDSITERQDLCLNMTKMSDEQVMRCIKEGAEELNKALELGLNDETYIKTGGYKKHTNIKDQLNQSNPIDPDNIKRNENDFSFNYSQAVFDMDDGLSGND